MKGSTLGSRKEQIRSELLVLRYRRGDQTALEEIVSTWERPLFYYVRRLVGSEADAWDTLQQVWLQVVRRMGRLREPSSLPAWLYRIAHNAAVSHLRENPSFESLSEDGVLVETVEGDAGPSFSEFGSQEIHRALDQLSLSHREVLTLRFLEGFSLAEIGEITGVSVGTVKSRLYYAKKAIREYLERETRRHE
jgi:RNA polymerase sigma-70 factor (ECF subfamily)